MIIDTKKKNSSNFNGFKVFVSCFQSGLFGFAIFFTVLLVSKFLGSLLDNGSVFKVELFDVVLSLIGFILMFLISFLKHISQNEKKVTTISPKIKK